MSPEPGEIPDLEHGIPGPAEPDLGTQPEQPGDGAHDDYSDED